MRLARLDAEEHNLARFGDTSGSVDSVNKCLFVQHYVIGRHHGQNGSGTLLLGGEGRDSDCCRGVACYRLEDDPLRLYTGALDLFTDEEPMLVVADDDRGFECLGEFEAIKRRAKQIGAVVKQAYELLGIARARKRPKACSGTAG